MNSFSTASNGRTPRIRFSFTTIAIGCTTTPVNRSVFVKRARSILGLFCNWRPYLFVRNVCANVTLQSLSTYGSYKMKTKLTILHHLIPLRNIKFRAYQRDHSAVNLGEDGGGGYKLGSKFDKEANYFKTCKPWRNSFLHTFTLTPSYSSFETLMKENLIERALK